MNFSISISGITLALAVTLVLSPVLQVPSFAQKANSGRSTSWRSAAQGAPDLQAAQKLVDENPKDAVALNDLGFALRQNGRLEEAENTLKKSVEIKPDLAEALCNLSVTQLDLGKEKDAMESAQKAVQINAKQPIFRVVLGNALAKNGQLKEAVQEYKTAIQIRPDYENAHFNLGRVLFEDKQFTEAKFVLAQALNLDPKDDRVIQLLDKLERLGSSTDPAAVKMPEAEQELEKK